MPQGGMVAGPLPQMSQGQGQMGPMSQGQMMQSQGQPQTYTTASSQNYNNR